MKWSLFLIIALLSTSCGLKLSLSKKDTEFQNISGVVSPLVGSISSYQSSMIVNTANAALCADPVYAKLFLVENDGSIDQANPLATELIEADARYSFDRATLNLLETTKVKYLIRVEGCNNDIYKRPVTNFDNKQNVDAKTTIVSEVVNANSLVANTLNEATRKDIEALINSISGTSIASAFTSLQSDTAPSNKFTQIFGTTPDVLQFAKPEVKLSIPTSLNELSPNNLSIQAFHIDPSYSFAYSWKLDGVVKSTASNYVYTPGANASGTHTVDLYAGRDNGSGSIDFTKPYVIKTISVVVNNNVVATPPNITLNASNPSPVNTTTVSVDLATGVALANCATFSHLAITDTATPPANAQFNIDCSTSGTQTESITFSNGDGTKTLYLWAIDNEGHISTPKTATVILDTLPPVASLAFTPTIVRGNSSQTITLSGSDAGVGLASLDLYFSATGSNPYTLVSNLSTTATSYSWTTPSIDTTTGKLKLVATDLTGLATTVFSNTITVDSIAPAAPTISRTSSATSNSTAVTISATCTMDYDKIHYSETSTTPLLTSGSWETCTSTKTFTASSTQGAKTIYAFTRDAAGNISTSSNVTMTLDTVAPGAPVATRTSNNISSSTAVTFTITDCLDRPYVLVSESMIAPSVSDSAWQTCSTTASAISYTLVGPVLQDSHTLYVYAKDSVGNISPSTSATMIYDTTNPTLSLSTTMASLYKGGDTVTLNFTASDTNGLSALKLEYASDGSTFSTLVSNLSTSATTYTWTIPSGNTTTAKLKLTATDNAVTANTISVTSNTFSIDSTAPTVPTIARTSAQYSQSNAVTISATCIADYSQIIYKDTVTTPDLTDAGWETCTATKTYTTPASDGAKSIYAFTRDTAGNISASANISMTLDTTAPTLSLTSFASTAYYQGGAAKNITWSASDLNLTTTPISISYALNAGTPVSIASALANSGTRAWTLPSINNATVTIIITATDLAGNVKTVTSPNFTIDSTAPTISNFTLAGGATTSSSPYVSFQLQSVDTLSKISSVCVKLTATAPLSTDTCWQPVSSYGGTSATSINITAGSFFLGVGSGTYNVYVWTKDLAELVSSLSNSGAGTAGVDKGQILFTQGSPPTLVNIVAANADITTATPSTAAINFTTAAPVYIKWKASDSQTLPATAINITYTNNDSTFTSVATALPNSAGTGCTVDGTIFTGCYKWTAPGAPNGYFRVRVTVLNSSGLTTLTSTGPLNSGNFRIVAGNTDNGYGGTATSAIINDTSWVEYSANSSKGQFVVDNSGVIYLIDINNGLMKVDPVTGVLNVYIPIATLSSGDGGQAAAATIKMPLKLTLDSQNRVLIQDGSLIRRIETNGVINTIIGGGSLTTDNILPLSLLLDYTGNEVSQRMFGTLTALPNGEIYFNRSSPLLQDIYGYDFRKYNPSTGLVEKIAFTGTGATGFPSFNLTNYYVSAPMAIMYDPTTASVKNFFTRLQSTNTDKLTKQAGFDPNGASLGAGTAIPPTSNWYSHTEGRYVSPAGTLYSTVHSIGKVFKYNSTANTWSTIYGTGTVGQCVDGTLATSCNAHVTDIFVGPNERVYVMDRRKIRMILPDGTIKTLAGQPLNFGDTGLAQSARFNALSSVFYNNYGSSNRVTVADNGESLIREFIVDGNINILAGNQTTVYGQNTAVAANAQATTPNMFTMPDGSTFVIYSTGAASAAGIYKLNRATNLWSYHVGGGATSYPSADGLTGSNIKLAGGITDAPGQLWTYFLGSDGNNVLLGSHNTIPNENSYLKLYNKTTGEQIHVAGNRNASGSTTLPAEGVVFGTTNLFKSLMPMTYDTANTKWLVRNPGNFLKIASFTVNTATPAAGAGAITNAATLPRAAYSMITRVESGHNVLYYCGFYVSTYRLFKYDMTQAIAAVGNANTTHTGSETMLPWPATSIACGSADSNQLAYDPTNYKLYFLVNQNNMSAVGEYYIGAP